MRTDRDPVVLCNPPEWDFDDLSSEKLETKHLIIVMMPLSRHIQQMTKRKQITTAIRSGTRTQMDYSV